MKRYTDLSEEELLALSDEEKQKYVDIELAFAGIIPMIKPVMDPVPEVNIKPTVQAFEIYGVFFTDEKDAFAVSKSSACDSQCISGLYDYRYLTPRGEGYNDGIKAKMFYTKAELEEVRTQLKERQRIEDKNSHAAKEWDAYLEKTEHVANLVTSAIAEAEDHKRRIDQAKTVYAKHYELAGGDEAIASRFFVDAYKDQPEIINEMFLRLADSDGTRPLYVCTRCMFSGTKREVLEHECKPVKAVDVLSAE
jgi:hypothetical protein